MICSSWLVLKLLFERYIINISQFHCHIQDKKTQEKNINILSLRNCSSHWFKNIFQYLIHFNLNATNFCMNYFLCNFILNGQLVHLCEISGISLKIRLVDNIVLYFLLHVQDKIWPNKQYLSKFALPIYLTTFEVLAGSFRP